MESKTKEIAKDLIELCANDGPWVEVDCDNLEKLSNGYLQFESALESANAEIADLKDTLERVKDIVPQRDRFADQILSLKKMVRDHIEGAETSFNQYKALESENKKLTGENETLKKEVESYTNNDPEEYLTPYENELLTKNTKLRAALEFYANQDNRIYCDRADGVRVMADSEGTSNFETDGGKTAREALEKLK